MNLFKRPKQHHTDDALAHRIAGNIIGRQRRIADYLNSKATYLSKRARLSALILFSLAFGSYCLYLLIK